MAIDSKNIQALEEMLKPHRGEMDVLKEALKEVTKEEGEKKKVAAKDLIRKGLDLQSRMNTAERTFNSEKKKFDKELGKVINRLKNMAQGRALDEGEDEEENKEGSGDQAQS